MAQDRLMQACLSGDADEAAAALHNGADVATRGASDNFLLGNILMIMMNDATPLHIACHQGHTDVVRLLLQAGADTEAVHFVGCTALGYACSYGHLGVVELLLQAGANVDICDAQQLTPLHGAALGGHTAIVRLLLHAGAHINVGHSTPLHFACSSGSADIVAALLAAGADIDARNEHGQTPLAVANEMGTAGIVAMLLEAGADMQQVPGEVSNHTMRAFMRVVDGQRRRLAALEEQVAAQREELRQLRGIQPGVQQLIVGAAGMLRQLHSEGVDS